MHWATSLYIFMIPTFQIRNNEAQIKVPSEKQRQNLTQAWLPQSPVTVELNVEDHRAPPREDGRVRVGRP